LVAAVHDLLKSGKELGDGILTLSGNTGVCPDENEQQTKERKNNSMKTVKTLSKTILSVRGAYALAMAALMPLSARAADEAKPMKPMKPMKGGEHMLMLNKVETKKDLDALKTDDPIAMVCTKCKTL
jgi:hypothetical protein